MPDLVARGYGVLRSRGVVEAAGGVQAGARDVVHTLALGRAGLVEGGAGRGHGFTLVTDFFLAAVALGVEVLLVEAVMFQFLITLHADSITKRL